MSLNFIYKINWCY